MGDATLQNLAARLSRLERQNRWLKIGGLAALAAVGGLLLIGATAPPKVVEAQQFVLRDENGATAATLTAMQDGPKLILYGAGEKICAALSVTKDGANLQLADAQGDRRALLGVAADGPGLVLLDPDDKPRVTLANTKLGPGMVIVDAKGQPIFAAPSAVRAETLGVPPNPPTAPPKPAAKQPPAKPEPMIKDLGQ